MDAEINAFLQVRLPEDKVIHVMDRDKEVAVLTTDWTKKVVYVEQFSASRFSLPFPTKGIGKFEVSTTEFVKYIRTRCFPDTRENRDHILKNLGLTGYNPYKIVQQTRGQQADDYVWFKFGEEDIDYASICIH